MDRVGERGVALLVHCPYFILGGSGMGDDQWVWEKVRILQQICEELKLKIKHLEEENARLKGEPRGEAEFAQGSQKVGFARGVL